MLCKNSPTIFSLSRLADVCMVLACCRQKLVDEKVKIDEELEDISSRHLLLSECIARLQGAQDALSIPSKMATQDKIAILHLVLADVADRLQIRHYPELAGLPELGRVGRALRESIESERASLCSSRGMMRGRSLRPSFSNMPGSFRRVSFSRQSSFSQQAGGCRPSLSAQDLPARPSICTQIVLRNREALILSGSNMGSQYGSVHSGSAAFQAGTDPSYLQQAGDDDEYHHAMNPHGFSADADCRPNGFDQAVGKLYEELDNDDDDDDDVIGDDDQGPHTPPQSQLSALQHPDTTSDESAVLETAMNIFSAEPIGYDDDGDYEDQAPPAAPVLDSNLAAHLEASGVLAPEDCAVLQSCLTTLKRMSQDFQANNHVQVPEHDDSTQSAILPNSSSGSPKSEKELQSYPVLDIAPGAAQGQTGLQEHNPLPASPAAEPDHPAPLAVAAAVDQPQVVAPKALPGAILAQMTVKDLLGVLVAALQAPGQHDLANMPLATVMEHMEHP